MPVNPIVLMYTRIKNFYIPITISNNQNTSTPAPFQQLITINPSLIGSNLFSSDLGNIRFYADYAFTQPLYAWVESGNSNTATTTNIWVKLPNGIPANSSITIYMRLENVGTEYDGVYMGEAPQLSSMYGEYDNGAILFNFYDNFAGTILKSSWSPYGTTGTTTVNNGLTLTKGSLWWGYKNTYQVSSPSIIDWYGEQTQLGGYGPASGTYTGIQFEQRTPDVPSRWGIEPTSNGVTSGGFYAGTSAYNTYYLVSCYYVSGAQSLYTNYNTLQVSSTYTIGTSNLIIASWQNSTSIFQYVRIRAYPPNGIMPSVSVGTL